MAGYVGIRSTHDLGRSRLSVERLRKLPAPTCITAPPPAPSTPSDSDCDVEEVVKSMASDGASLEDTEPSVAAPVQSSQANVPNGVTHKEQAKLRVLQVRVDDEEQFQAFLGIREQKRIVQLFAKRGHGSCLRGWRKLLDREGLLEVPFAKFCEVCVQTGVVKGAQELMVLPRDFTVIALNKAMPHGGIPLQLFRKWMVGRYENHSSFFEAMDPDGRGQVSREGFVDFCKVGGYDGVREEVEEIYGCCDVDNKGYILPHEVVFMELDIKLRDRELAMVRRNREQEHENFLANFYNDQNAKKIPVSNRLFQRPWMSHHFEDLPEIDMRRRFVKEQKKVFDGLEARATYMRYLRKLYGTEAIAWRRGLDKDNKFIVSEAQFRAHCRQIDFEGDVDALLYSLDPDRDGTVTLAQISVHAANLLAQFHSWAHRMFGSCAALWDCPVSVSRRTKVSLTSGSASGEDRGAVLSKHLTKSHFAEVLRTYGCPAAAGCPPVSGQTPEGGMSPAEAKSRYWFLFRALDYCGVGFITLQDLEYLDLWEPNPYLTASADEAAWLDLKKLLLNRYGNMLRAWRFELDTDNSNRLSWTEFLEACERLKFKGNIGGIWRFLDNDLAGVIGLSEIDEESSTLLHSFKDWAEKRFGNLQKAFQVMGSDGNGTFQYRELKNACVKFKWKGNTRLLFDCLTVNGDNVSYKDASFIAGWAAKDEESIRLFNNLKDKLWHELLDSAPTASRPKTVPSTAASTKSTKQSSSSSQWSLDGAGSLESPPSKFNLASTMKAPIGKPGPSYPLAWENARPPKKRWSPGVSSELPSLTEDAVGTPQPQASASAPLLRQIGQSVSRDAPRRPSAISKPGWEHVPEESKCAPAPAWRGSPYASLVLRTFPVYTKSEAFSLDPAKLTKMRPLPESPQGKTQWRVS